MKFHDMRFSTEHEWVRFEEDSDEVEVGITEFAAGELGDIVFVELPEVGTEVSAEDSMGTIEAVKTVADLYAPISGEIIEVNAILEDRPETINDAPYEEGWMVRIRMSDRSELDSLMEHAAYKEMIGKT
ncbi:MAG TPA: glycine cleavage system protein GcvH [Chromatiales bacterium]|nr:glycine cleavage system protein GcvH [Chromatiales bacterium]